MYGNNQYERPYPPRQSASYEDPSMYAERLAKQLDGCSQCLKYMLVIFNILFLITIIATVGVAIFILIDESFLAEMMNNNYMLISCWLLISAGMVTFVTIFVGCFGALKSHKCYLFAYGGILLLTALALAAGGILALSQRHRIQEWKIENMENELQDMYGVNLDVKENQLVTQAWDKAQEDMHCCGVRDQSWGVYRQSLWYAEQEGIETVDKPYVPPTCCKKDMYGYYTDLDKCQTFYQGPPATVSGQYNEAIHYRGCYTAGKEWIEYYSAWLGGMGLGSACLLLFGVVFSPWLGCRLRVRLRN